MKVRIASHADRCTGVRVHPSDLATLQAHDDLLDTLPILLLTDHDRIRARAAAEDGTLVLCAAEIVHLRSQRHHPHRETIPTESRPGRKHAGIHDAAHASQQFLRQARAITLHRIPSAHALRSDDITLPFSARARQQCNVRRAARVVLDAVDDMRAWRHAKEVDHADAPLVPSAAVAHRHAPGVVPSTDALALARKGERHVRPARPEVVVDGPPQMADAGRARFVALECESAEGGGDGGLRLGGRGGGGRAVAGQRGGSERGGGGACQGGACCVVSEVSRKVDTLEASGEGESLWL